MESLDSTETESVSTHDPVVERSVQSLVDRARTPITLDQRIELISTCIRDLGRGAEEWITLAWDAKQLREGDPARAEEVATGPIATVRFLQLALRTLGEVKNHGRPLLPGTVEVKHGQCRVPVFPTPILYDSLLFQPFTAETWLESDVAADRVCYERTSQLLNASGTRPVLTILGAGNVSSIPATDMLTKVLLENHAVALKLSPVNDYLSGVFQQSFRSLIDAGLLSIVTGDKSAGAQLIQHPGVNCVHITGSHHTHDAIVWGSGEESARRRSSKQPVLSKEITSELGNVTPWLIIPGRYSEADLRHQAEMVATSITNNASFNCIATKLIVTSRHWPQRRQFLDLLGEILDRTPPRFAYYPGAAERFTRFTGTRPNDESRLPWTVIEDIDPSASQLLLNEESFTCVCAEVAMSADDDVDFLTRAVAFCNDEVWGTLAAAITTPDEFAEQHATELDRALMQLRYGTVGVNTWPALAFAFMTSPWGGFPGACLADVQSGIGFVHNTYLLDRPEKTVLRAPLQIRPKPIWHASHRHPTRVTLDMLRLYVRPSVMRMPRLMLSALTG